MLRFITKIFSNRSFLIFGLISILPFLILSFFIHPLGTHEWDWVTIHAGFLPDNLSFWEQQSYWYENTMGRFTSTFLLSLTPYWFSLTNFKIYPILFILGLLLSLRFVFSSLFQNAPTVIIWGITVGTFILYLDQMTGPFEDLYCLSCSMTYQTGAIFSLFLVGGIIYLRSNKYKKRQWLFIPIILLCAFTPGTNEVSMIFLNLFLALLLLGIYFKKRRLDKIILGFWIVCLIGSFFAISAPGNFVRMDAAPNANNVLLTIFLSFSIYFFNWLRWLSSTPLLLLAILYLPVGLKLARRLSGNDLFQFPLLTFIGVSLFQITTLAALFWSLGDEALPERVMDLLFLMTLPCLLYLEQCTIVFLLEKGLLAPRFKLSRLVRIALVVFIGNYLLFNNLKVDKEGNNTSNYLSLLHTNSNIGTAWLELLNGNAKRYNQYSYGIYEKIKECNGDLCEVDPPKRFPKIIYDPTYDRKGKKGDIFMGRYFNEKVKVVRYKKASN